MRQVRKEKHNEVWEKIKWAGRRVQSRQQQDAQMPYQK
jgi:hypothetical protein